jgi:hypothetical protein
MFINDVGQITWEEIDDGHCRFELRLAVNRGSDQQSVLPIAHLLVRARDWQFSGLRDHRWHVLQPGYTAVSGELCRCLFLRRFLRRLDQCVRPRQWHRTFRHGIGARSICGPAPTAAYISARDPGVVVRSTTVWQRLPRNYVQEAHVAYYGRPADPGGPDYWALAWMPKAVRWMPSSVRLATRTNSIAGTAD